MSNRLTNYRIVADSAADLFIRDTVPFAAAPLKVITAEREFVDTAELDVAAMVDYLKAYKGKSTSSCPNPDEWLSAFGDADYVFGVTLTSGLSGSYNAAVAAGQLYMAEHPDRRVFILDSLSAGPAEMLLVETLEQLILAGHDFDTICAETTAAQQRTKILFTLQSLTNFANNGRVSPAVAKVAGLLGICVVAKASDEGTIDVISKCRGMNKAMDCIVTRLKESGFSGGRVRIAHCFNETDAHTLRSQILAAFPTADVKIHATNGLCSFYAERGGLLVGYEV